jgi:hypothetical protein
MSVGVEIADVTDAFIVSRLRADPTIAGIVGRGSAARIFADVAPELATLPVIVFQVQAAGPDTMAVGAVRVQVRPLYLVRAIARQESWQGQLRTLGDRIDAVLHKAALSATADGVVWGSVREEAFRLVESEGGVQHRHLGGLYRLWAEGI